MVLPSCHRHSLALALTPGPQTIPVLPDWVFKEMITLKWSHGTRSSSNTTSVLLRRGNSRADTHRGAPRVDTGRRSRRLSHAERSWEDPPRRHRELCLGAPRTVRTYHCHPVGGDSASRLGPEHSLKNENKETVLMMKWVFTAHWYFIWTPLCSVILVAYPASSVITYRWQHAAPNGPLPAVGVSGPCPWLSSAALFFFFKFQPLYFFYP